jgi:drug/metabolite transporter (DMT)-like permease
MPAHNSPTLSKGYLIAFIATILWSSTAVFIRYLTETFQLPPLVLAFWRDLIVAFTLGMAIWITRRSLLKLPRIQWPFLLLFGLVLALFNSTWTVSVAFNGAAVSTVLAYSSAGFTALLAWRFLGERLDWTKIIAVSMSLAGCVLVSGAYDPTAWHLNPIGISVGLISGLAFAVYSLMGRSASHRGLHPLTTLLYTFAFGSAFLLLFNFLPPGTGRTPLTSLLWLGTHWDAWIVLIVLAVGPTIGGYGLYTISLVYLPASVANLIATLEPALTAVLAYIFLAERLTLPQIIGSVLILSGVLFLRWFESRLEPVPAPA